MNNEEIHNLLKIENDKTTIFTNKELKMIDDYINELEAYKYNMDRDYLRLEQENKILRENAEHNDKVVDKVNWENQKLKKQLEEYKRLGFKHLNDKCNKLENQQKEFIEYINEKIDICDGFIDTIRSDLEEISCGGRIAVKTYIANEIMKNEVAKKCFSEILSKYKEIIGNIFNEKE